MPQLFCVTMSNNSFNTIAVNRKQLKFLGEHASRPPTAIIAALWYIPGRVFRKTHVADVKVAGK